MAKQVSTTGQGIDETNPKPSASDNTVKSAIETIKELAKKGILNKYPVTGVAINFLLFGGYGVPGILDDAMLMNEALKSNNKELGKEFTEDMATELVMDLAGLAITKAFQKAGVTVLERLENPLLFLSILFSSEKIGDSTLPPELKPPIPGKKSGGAGSADDSNTSAGDAQFDAFPFVIGGSGSGGGGVSSGGGAADDPKISGGDTPFDAFPINPGGFDSGGGGVSGGGGGAGHGGDGRGGAPLDFSDTPIVIVGSPGAGGGDGSGPSKFPKKPKHIK